MKKILYTLAALFVSIAASAQCTMTAGDVQSVEIEGETYKAITVSLENTMEATSFQCYFPGAEDVIVDVQPEGDIISQVKVGLKMVDNFIFTYSPTSNMKKPTCFVYFNTAAGKTKKVIESGEIFTVYLVNSASDDLVIEGQTSTFGVDTKMTPITVKTTGINGAKSDEESVKANKYMTKKGLVIVKGNKKYNAASQEIE